MNKDLFIYNHSEHQWAWEMFDLHESLHWLPEEVPMQDDIRDWKKNPSEFLRHIMLFFVQADIEVGNTYIDTYIPQYPDLAIRTMLTSFAAREGIHIKGYAYLAETLQLGDGIFSAFIDDPVLAGIHNLLGRLRDRAGDSPASSFANMVGTTLLGEGVMLFGQFAMLLNFQRFNRFSGMSTIVAWSIRDEDVHVHGIATVMKKDPLFNAIPLAERQRIYKEVYDELMPLVQSFVKTCFDMEQPEGIEEQDVYQFLEYQAQRRARQANIQDDEITIKNPFLWFDQIVGGVEHSNFFERRATEYSKGGLDGEYEY